MTDVRFDVAGKRDLVEVIAWMRVFYRDEGFDFGPECEQALEQLIADGGLGAVVVMRDGGQGVGYFLLTFGFSVERGGKTALLDELYVAPEMRGRGIGRAAVGEARRLAREAGCAALFVEVDVGNKRARNLYEKSGFGEMGRDYLMAEL